MGGTPSKGTPKDKRLKVNRPAGGGGGKRAPKRPNGNKKGKK